MICAVCSNWGPKFFFRPEAIKIRRFSTLNILEPYPFTNLRIIDGNVDGKKFCHLQTMWLMEFIILCGMWAVINILLWMWAWKMAKMLEVNRKILTEVHESMWLKIQWDDIDKIKSEHQVMIRMAISDVYYFLFNY